MTGTAHTLVDLLREQAERYHDKVAFHFSYNGDDEDAVQLTYRELDAQARAVAADLQRHGAAGQRVLVIVRPGLDFIIGYFGCLYAGAIAVPVHQKLAPRLPVIIPDAEAGFALTAIENQANTRAGAEKIPGCPPVWLLTDAPGATADDWVPPAVDAQTPAMIQYTSGSTRSPKGVVLTHANLLHNVEAVRAAWNGTDDAICVWWLPPHHDMGLIGGVLSMIYIGTSTVLMSPTGFIKRPMRWLEAISRHRASYTAAPNFAYDKCVESSTAEERAALDLSCLTTAMNGAEPVRAASLAAFADAFAPAGFSLGAFMPVYGLAEASLLVSGGSESPVPGVRYVDREALGADRIVDIAPEHPAAAALVGCGKVRGGQDVRIVDPTTLRECGVDEVGEIWVAGPSVGAGYWRRPEETAQSFAGRLADGTGPYLRSGDLGFFCAGELFITGRVKDLVVIDGHHYYPNDVENTVQAVDPALASGRGAVFAVTPEPTVFGPALDRLVVVQELDRQRSGADTAVLIESVRAAVRHHHGLDAAAVLLVEHLSIPTTSSGKIQRGACRQRYLDGALAPLAEWHAPPTALDAAAQLAARLQQALGEQGPGQG